MTKSTGIVGTFHVEKQADEESQGYQLRIESGPDGFVSVTGKMHRDDIEGQLAGFSSGLMVALTQVLPSAVPLLGGAFEKVAEVMAKRQEATTRRLPAETAPVRGAIKGVSHPRSVKISMVGGFVILDIDGVMYALEQKTALVMSAEIANEIDQAERAAAKGDGGRGLFPGMEEMLKGLPGGPTLVPPAGNGTLKT